MEQIFSYEKNRIHNECRYSIFRENYIYVSIIFYPVVHHKAIRYPMESDWAAIKS